MLPHAIPEFLREHVGEQIIPAVLFPSLPHPFNPRLSCVSIPHEGVSCANV